jgi:hypothetical protein
VTFRPQIGSLRARLFENSHLGIPLSLWFDIEIPIEPFEFEGRDCQTSARLDFIEIAVADWRELWGCRFNFPVNPERGYIDGSILLGNAHNPADVTVIRFGHPSGEVVPVALEIRVDFTAEGPAELGKADLDWHTDLTFREAELDTAFAEARARGVL